MFGSGGIKCGSTWVGFELDNCNQVTIRKMNLRFRFDQF